MAEGRRAGRARRRAAAADGSAGLERGIDRLESRRSSKEPRRLAGDLRGQRARGRAEKLLTRTTSGAIYALVIIACLLVGVEATFAVVAAMAWLCCSEFFHLARLGGRMPNEVVGLTAAVLFPAGAWLRGEDALLMGAFALLAACAVWYVLTPRASVADVAVTVFGPLYTSLTFSCLVLVRACDPGLEGGLLALGVMGSVWLNDAVAYLVGSRLGSRKLAPRISPNKTQEGLWAGIAASVAMWLVIALVGVRGVGVPLALVAGPVMGVVAVVGDLFESRVKRGVGVKDSGTIMPGHGGLLDRSDSMLFGCMTAYLILRLGAIL